MTEPVDDNRNLTMQEVVEALDNDKWQRRRKAFYRELFAEDYEDPDSAGSIHGEQR